MLDQVFVRLSEPTYQPGEKWHTLPPDLREAQAKEDGPHATGRRCGSRICLESRGYISMLE